MRVSSMRELRLIVAWLLLGGASVSRAQTTAPADGALDFGTEGFTFPTVQVSNAVTARTATLLGDAYRRREPLVWRRVQYVAELCQSAQPAAAPYLVEAMK